MHISERFYVGKYMYILILYFKTSLFFTLNSSAYVFIGHHRWPGEGRGWDDELPD